MSVLISVRLQRGYSEVLEREVREGFARRSDIPEELEALIEAEADQPEKIRQLWDKVADRARVKSLDNVDVAALETEFRSLFDGTLASLRCLGKWSQQVHEQTGKRVRGSDALEQTCRAVEVLQQKIMADLAWFNEPPRELSDAQYAEALAAIERGEVEDVEDIIRELQGDLPEGGSPADR